MFALCDQRNSSSRRATILLLYCCAYALPSSGGAPLPQEASCSASIDVVQVADGIYVRRGHPAVVFEGDEIANVGFIIGDRCVAVIDTGGSVEEGAALDCTIRQLTDRPVCYVINTHVHPDHLLGNKAFLRSGVEFIGHVKLPRALALRGDIYLERASTYARQELPDSTIVFPQRTVADSVQLDIGGRILTLQAHQTAHTDNDLSVVDQKTMTAFLGDLVFLEHLPVLDGSINGWIGELETLTGETFNYVVPGHGPVRARWPSAATPTLQYLTGLRDEVRARIAVGDDLALAQREIRPSRADDWVLLDRYHRRNVGAAYAELEWED